MDRRPRLHGRDPPDRAERVPDVGQNDKSDAMQPAPRPSDHLALPAARPSRCALSAALAPGYTANRMVTTPTGNGSANIECGTTGERRTRITILVVALLASSLWFAYDGWIGWPAQNEREYREQLPPDARGADLRILPDVTEAKAKTLATARTLEEIETVLGGSPGAKTAFDVRWYGPGGSVVVELKDGRPSGPVTFRPARRTETSLLWQKIIAVGLFLGFLAALRRFIRVRGERYRLDDSGVTIRNTGPIHWESMQRLESDRYVEKGWVDLHYTENGSPKTIRLDSYEIADFDDFIDEICRRRGFENPLPVGATTDTH